MPLLTKTQIAKLKLRAKHAAASATASLTYNQALESVARKEGFASWSLLLSATRQTPDPETPADKARALRESLARLDRDQQFDYSVPLNPVLPADFDSTTNELRSDAELSAWWDRPYARTLTDGRLEVRCLDGGAHDRSTWYGVVDDHRAAQDLAQRAHQTWLGRRRREVLYADDDGIWWVRMPQRPDEDIILIERR